MLLIIEDNVQLVELYRTSMDLVNIKPEVIMTGPAALRRINNSNGQIPSCVLLDLHLRKEDNVEVTGEELFYAMRAAWPSTKIIVVSADIVWASRFRGVADEVIEKPIVDMWEFLETVQKFMGILKEVE